jgi:hypothetical protein
MLKTLILIWALSFACASHADISEDLRTAVVPVQITHTSGSFVSEAFGNIDTINAVVIDSSGLALTLSQALSGHSKLTANGGMVELISIDVIPIPLSSPDISYKRGDPFLNVTSEKITKINFATQKNGLTEFGALRQAQVLTYPPQTKGFRGSALLNFKGQLVGIGEELTIDTDIDPSIRVPGNKFIYTGDVLGSLSKMLSGKHDNAIWHGMLLHKARNKPLEVNFVLDGSPAMDSGIQVGASIYAINNKAILNYTGELFTLRISQLYATKKLPIQLTLLKPNGTFYDVLLSPITFRERLAP